MSWIRSLPLAASSSTIVFSFHNDGDPQVFIGSAGAEYRARGYLAAFDSETGKELWRFHTVPGNPDDGFENPAMERAPKTWAGEWWKFGGGGTVWDAITYDPSTNLVLFGTGNAEPWNPASTGRGGDNLFASSVVAVDADTGRGVPPSTSGAPPGRRASSIDCTAASFRTNRK